jgi:hypothetical protein
MFELQNVIVGIGPESASVQGLKVDLLPDCFETRYGNIPPVIYVRECYRSLYDTASASILIKQASAATLFTGVPGIGKSLFLVYFIYRFLHDERFEDKCFAVEFEKGKYELFRPTANLEATEFSCTRVSRDCMYHRSVFFSLGKLDHILVGLTIF